MKRGLIIFCLVILNIGMIFPKSADPVYGGSFTKPDFAFPKSVDLRARDVLSHDLSASPEKSVKALIQLSVASNMISTSNFESVMETFDSVAKILPSPYKNIVLSLESQAYTERFLENAYVYRQRSLSLSAPWPENTSAWSADMYGEKVMELTAASLDNSDELTRIPLSTIKTLLDNYSSSTDRYLPSVYDLLAWRAIDRITVFTSNERIIPFGETALSSIGAKAYIMRQKLYSHLASINHYHPDALALIYSSQSALMGDDGGRWLLSRFENFKDSPASLSMLNALRRYVNDDTNNQQAPVLTKKEYYDRCMSALSLFPNADYSSNIRNIITDMTAASVYVTPKGAMMANNPLNFDVSLNNISDCYLLLIKADTNINSDYINNMDLYKRPITAVKRINVTEIIPFQKNLEVTLEGVESGYYAIIASRTDKLNDAVSFYRNGTTPLIRVGSLTAYTAYANTINDIPLVYVVESASQKPVSDANVVQKSVQYPNRGKILRVETTNSQGAAEIDKGSTMITVSKNDESFSFNSYIGNTIIRKVNTTLINVLTDLPLYHPGDSLSFAAICYEDTTRGFKPVCNHPVTAYLINVNGETVDSTDLITDTYGRVAGKMLIPKSGILGYYTVKCVDGKVEGNSGVMIADYKTPTFFVETDSIATDYTPGADIVIKGKVMTYSGMPLNGAQITLQLKHIPAFRWWSNPDGTYGVIATSSPDGFFQFSLPTAGLIGTSFENGLFTGNVIATSQTGETETGNNFRFCLGNNYSIQADIPQMVQIDNNHLKGLVNVYNAAGISQSLDVSYRIIDTSGSQVSGGSFTAPNFDIAINKLTSGLYNISFTLERDTSIESQASFIIYGNSDKYPPVKSQLWVPEKKIITPFDVKTIKVKVGNSYPGEAILCRTASDTAIINTEWIYPDGKIITINAPAPANGSRIFVEFTSVHECNIQTEVVEILPESATARLETEIISFRNKIIPGQNEKWTFRFINSPINNKCKIAAIAVMTDKAINSLSNFDWHFNPTVSYQSPLHKQLYYRYIPTWSYQAPHTRDTRYYSFTYPKINTYGMSLTNGATRHGQVKLYRAAIVQSSGTIAETEEVSLETASMVNASQAMKATSDKVNTSKTDESTWRGNECPLAFFYPLLTSDSDGYLNVSFTVPDFNTTWQFQLLGYDSQMRTTKSTLYSIAAKPVMVQTLAPQFLRTSDIVTIQASVFNNTESIQAITGIIEILNPLTDEVVKSESYTINSLNAKESSVISLQLTTPTDEQILAIRVCATMNNFTDGEQFLISIVPSSTPVLESSTFYLPANSDNFITIVPKYDNGTTTLTYCNNPIWYCISALPDFSTPTASNIFSLSQAYYSNTLAMHLALKYPEIKKALDTWSKKNNSFTSPLYDNESLKILTLNNTIWVNNAHSESIHINQLVNLLDSTHNLPLQNSILSSISSLQAEDGGLQWIPGVQPSMFSTSQALLYFGFINKNNCLTADYHIDSIIRKCINYCDSKALSEYTQSVNNRFSFPSNYLLHWFYIRSFFKEKMTPKINNLLNLTLRHLRAEWETMSINDAATAAILLHRNGDNSTVKYIMESLRQKASISSEKGMWFDNLQSYYNSTSTLLTTSRILEAYAEISPKAPEIDMIRQWLLIQRQGQDWGSEREMIHVIYSLLTSGTDWISISSNPIIKLDNRILRPDSIEQFTGNFTMVLDNDSVAGGRLSIEKTNSAPAWGGIINQRIEPMSNITETGSQDLSVKKQIFVIDQNGLAHETNNLKIGDRVRITLTLNTKRDLDYVAITDERASCMIVADQIPQFIYSQNLGYYYAPDLYATNLFINFLPKGTHIISYDCYVQSSGEFASGIATVQSQYAPAIAAHSAGQVLNVKE